MWVIFKTKKKKVETYQTKKIAISAFFFTKTQKNIKKTQKIKKSIYKNKLMYIILKERGNMSQKSIVINKK